MDSFVFSLDTQHDPAATDTTNDHVLTGGLWIVHATCCFYHPGQPKRFMHVSFEYEGASTLDAIIAFSANVLSMSGIVWREVEHQMFETYRARFDFPCGVACPYPWQADVVLSFADVS